MKNDTGNSGSIPSLVKYKMNPKSDEYSKWRVLKSQYMKLYPKEAANMPAFGETKRRSQTTIGKQSIVNVSPEKVLGSNNNKDRTPTLYEKNNMTPSHKHNANNESLQSIKENFNKNELGIPSLGKMSRANTTTPYDLLTAIDTVKNDATKPKSTIFNRSNLNASSPPEKGPEKNESSILMNIAQNREKEKQMEKDQDKNKQSMITPLKVSTFGGNINKDLEVIKIPIVSSPPEKTDKNDDHFNFNFRKPNFNRSYIEEYLKRIHFTGKKEAFEISNDFMNEEDQEIDREIHVFQKKLTEVIEHIKSLGFRKSKRHVKDPSESRYIDQLVEVLRDEEPLLAKLIERNQEKLEMKNEIRTLRSLIETCIKTGEEKTKEHEKEVKSLRELIENFNENRVFSLEMENKKLKDEIAGLKRDNKEIQELLDKKSKELSFLYADAENTKESIISELKNLKELKDRLLQEKQRFEVERREGMGIGGSPEDKEKLKQQTFIIQEPGKQEKAFVNNTNSRSKFVLKGNSDLNSPADANVSGRFSKVTAEILENRGNNDKRLNSQPVMFKDVKEPASSKGLFYQDIKVSEKLKVQNLNVSRTNSIASSK